MADPVTWAIIAGSAAVASAGVAAYSSYQQGKSAEAMGEYNQEVAEQEAKRQEELARLELREKAEEKRRWISMQTALYGKSGVQMAGTPLRTMVETAKTFAREQQMLGYNRGIEATAYRNQANLYGYQGKAAKRAGMFGAGSSLIGGAAQIGQTGLMYSMYKKGQ